MSRLCSFCASVDFANLPAFPEWIFTYHAMFDADYVPFIPTYHLDWQQDPTKTLGIPHHPNLASLRDASKSCRICGLIDVGAQRVQEIMKIAEGDSYFNDPKSKCGPPTYELFICSRRGVPHAGKDQDGFLVLSPGIGTYEITLIASVGFAVAEDSNISDKIGGRIVDPDPLSPSTINRISRWLLACDREHTHAPAMPKELPSRVLDVDHPDLESDMIRLHESAEGETAHFATLSHCWGASHTIITTKTNIVKHKTSIRIDSLPQTFKDAITVTRKLHIRYLWVDSLCICQDDADDWQRESYKMSEIYTNSFVSIAAARSRDDKEGFLSLRPRIYEPIEMRLDGTLHTVYAWPVPLSHAKDLSSYSDMTDEPLSQRGWALQERFLAPRKLHFGSTQISFECSSHFLTEDGYSQSAYWVLRPDAPADATKWKWSNRTMWQTVVARFSERKLTKASDKLPAIAGLARAIHRVNGGAGDAGEHYVAGLSRNNIIEDLCWQVYSQINRPEQYRAPSWSWASLDGFISTSDMRHYEPLITVRSATAKVTGSNALGQVVSGSLVLDCIIEAVVRKSNEERPRRRSELRFEDESVSKFSAIWDTDADNQQDDKVYVVPIAWREPKPDHKDYARLAGRDKKGVKCLIVELVEASGDNTLREAVYRRIGWAGDIEESSIERWIKANKQRLTTTITIV